MCNLKGDVVDPKDMTAGQEEAVRRIEHAVAEHEGPLTCECGKYTWTGSHWKTRDFAPVLRAYCWGCHMELVVVPRDGLLVPVVAAMVPKVAVHNAEVVMGRYMLNLMEELDANDTGLHEDVREELSDIFELSPEELDAEEAPDGD